MKISNCIKNILTVTLTVSFASCGGSGGSTSSTTSTAAATSQTGSTQAAVNGAASNTASVAQQSGQGVATLIKVQRASRNLVPGGASAFEAESVDFEDSYDCDEAGTMSFAGTQSYELAEDFSTFSMTADSTVTFDNCTEDQIVEASDGSCLLTAAMDGDIDEDFTFDMTLGDLEDDSDDTFSMEVNMFSEGITMTIFGDDDSESSVEVGFDLSMNLAGIDDEYELTGTITIDGVEYDASEDIDTLSYSMEELGCVQVVDEDGDGEEDSEPGEEGYDFEDEGEDFDLSLCDVEASDSVLDDGVITELCSCADEQDLAIDDCESVLDTLCSEDSLTAEECVDAISDQLDESTDDEESDDSEDDAE